MKVTEFEATLRGRPQSTLGFLAEISFTPPLYHPGGCLGCPEKGTRSRNYTLLISIGKLKPTIGMITYVNTCALDSKGKITYKLI